MGKRVYLALLAALAIIIIRILASTRIATGSEHNYTNDTSSDSSLIRTHTVGFVYVTTYKNRLTNSQATVNIMQKFFDTVEWRQDQQYSFLRDVVHNNFKPDDGFVGTPLGYAYGSCGASSLLNKLVKTTKFRDSDGVLKPVFETVVVHTWSGDKNYGKWGATNFLDPTGKKTEDYIWKLNPDYDGPPPKITTNFDMVGETVSITMQYGDEVAAPTTASPAATSEAAPAPTDEATSEPMFSPAVIDSGMSDASYVVQATAVPPIKPTRTSVEQVSAPGDSGQAIVKLSPDNTARQLTQELTDLVKAARFGVSVIPIRDSALIMTEPLFNSDTEAFVASAFKGPVAIYFFENVDSAVWKDVPVKYWLAKSDKEMPAEVRESWQKNKDLLKDLYQ